MDTASKNGIDGKKSDSRAAIEKFMRSFGLYEFPFLDPNSHYLCGLPVSTRA
jgi:hypothetical protein